MYINTKPTKRMQGTACYIHTVSKFLSGNNLARNLFYYCMNDNLSGLNEPFT